MLAVSVASICMIVAMGFLGIGLAKSERLRRLLKEKEPATYAELGSPPNMWEAPKYSGLTRALTHYIHCSAFLESSNAEVRLVGRSARNWAFTGAAISAVSAIVIVVDVVVRSS